MLNGLTDYCLQMSVEALSKALNISTQHCWIVLWHVVKELAKRTEHLQHPKMFQQKFDHFQT